MAKNEFRYYYSKILRQKFKQQISTGIIGFKDGVKYSVAEQDILKKNKPGPQEKRDLHIMKRIFKGEIIE